MNSAEKWQLPNCHKVFSHITKPTEVYEKYLSTKFCLQLANPQFGKQTKTRPRLVSVHKLIKTYIVQIHNIWIFQKIDSEDPDQNVMAFQLVGFPVNRLTSYSSKYSNRPEGADKQGL